MATTSSGFTPWWGSLPNSSWVASITLGIRVMPPTMTISSMSPAATPESVIACLHGPTVRLIRSSTSCSRLDRVRVMTRCLGPEASAVINGRFISVCTVVESSILARSADSLSLCRAMLSCLRSMPWSFLNSSTIQSTMRWSKSSPPRCVSPLVALTSKTPSPI